MTKTKAPKFNDAKPNKDQTAKMSELLLGQNIIRLEGAYQGSELVIFHLESGLRVRMCVQKDWGSSIYLEDVAGDIEDLIGVVTLSEAVVDFSKTRDGKLAWTFYRLATKAGMVVFRWYGEAGPYYSVEVFVELDQTLWQEATIFNSGISLEDAEAQKVLAHFRAFDTLPKETLYFKDSKILSASDINWTDFDVITFGRS